MSQALADGAIFAGRYRVMRCIASGGMGAVYEVLHLETERRRALKVMLPDVFAKPEMRERFKREAKIAAHIDSDHLVDVFDAGVDEATSMPFLVMELLKGEEIGKRLKRVGRFPPAEAIAYLHQTAQALDLTHRAAIVHRDLKPGNLFLAEREGAAPRIKVLDFGIAKLVVEATAEGGATQGGLGTPVYMAPEQWRADARLTPAADLYALGQIAYTLLVGAPYWREDLRDCGNVFAFAGLTMTGLPEPATTRAARAGVQLPPAFDAWFSVAVAVDPAARFPSASAAVAALARVFEVALPFPPASTTPSFPPGVPDPLPLPAAPPDFPTMTGATLRTAASSLPVRPSMPAGAKKGTPLVAVAAGAVVLGALSAGAFLRDRPGSAAGTPEPPASVAVTPAAPSPSASTAAAPTPAVAETASAAPVASTSASPSAPARAAKAPSKPAAPPTPAAAKRPVAKPTAESIYNRD